MNNTKNEYCRLCAELKPHIELTNLQTEEETCQRVVNKLSRFNIVMDFKENILPKTVCLICVKSLERAFAFITAVEQAQAFLSDFILVQINTASSDYCAENMFYEPPDNENGVDGCKDEHSRDKMEADDVGTNLSEKCDSEVRNEFNLVQTRSLKNDSYGESTFYAPSDVSEEVFDVKAENCCDPMDVNDKMEVDDVGTNLSEKCYSEVRNELNLVQTRPLKNDSYEESTFYAPSDVSEEVFDSHDPMGVNDDEELDNQDFSNVHNDDGNNLGSENVHTENMDNIHYSYEIVEEKIGTKDETMYKYTVINNVKNIKGNESLNFSNDYREAQNTNVGENDLNIKDAKLPSVLQEELGKDILITEVNSEPILPLNCSVYSTDNINNQYYGTMYTKTVGSAEPHKWIQTICKPIPPELFDTRVFSEDDIIKQINRLGSVPVQYIKNTWMDYEWKCSHCGTLFSNIEELQTHSMLYHNTCNAYQCTDCKIKKQRLNAFIKHVRSHRKYLHYSCYKCFEKFPRTTETIQHKTKAHENSEHVCLGCNTPFSSNTELEEHVNKYYSILWRKNTLINGDNLTCSTCNKVCTSVIALRNHLNTHKEKKLDCVCDRCGKCFDSKPKLRTHMDTHIEKILYQCEICKSTFKTVYTLRYHMSIHSGIKPFTCDVCSKCFRNKTQVRNHMKVHTDYVPITCTVCNKKFRTDSYLQNHMLQHTGEKPFSCDICPRDFTNRANRNKHMRRRHAIEMGKKREPIIKQQTADDTTSSDLATRDTKLADLNKMNERKNKIMVHRKSQRANSKLKKKKKVISKECNEN